MRHDKGDVTIVHDELERTVDTLKIKKKKMFVILTPAEVVAFVPLGTPSRPRFVIKTTFV